MLCGADRPYPRPAAAVRYGEGFVQVEVAYVGAYEAGVGVAHLRVHVCPVHVNLPAVAVHNACYFADFAFEHAVRRGVGNHEAGEVLGVEGGLLLQVFYADVPLLVAGYHYDGHARHGGACRVCAVRRGGDERYVAVRRAARDVVSPDGHQPCVLAVGAGVWLKRNGVEPRNFCQVFGQLVHQLVVSLRLIAGHKGVYVAELLPGDGEHFGGGVELHGARA